MTEAEWQACTHPSTMLQHLCKNWKYSLFELGRRAGFFKPNATERKLRLFACACMRHAWHRLDGSDHFGNDLRTRRAVEIAERHADGCADDGELARAGERHGLLGADTVTHKLASDAAAISAAEAARLLASNNLDDPARHAVEGHLCSLMRDLIGPLLFRPVTINPRWITTTVISITQAIYDNSRFGDMPILADALEEAGCNNANILGHCREPGPHVRGCWVVDLLLDKK